MLVDIIIRYNYNIASLGGIQVLLNKNKENKTGEINQENYTHIMNLIMEDYSNYFKASSYLQTRYEVCLQAIYSLSLIHI